MCVAILCQSLIRYTSQMREVSTKTDQIYNQEVSDDWRHALVMNKGQPGFWPTKRHIQLWCIHHIIECLGDRDGDHIQRPWTTDKFSYVPIHATNGHNDQWSILWRVQMPISYEMSCECHLWQNWYSHQIFINIAVKKMVGFSLIRTMSFEVS